METLPKNRSVVPFLYLNMSYLLDSSEYDNCLKDFKDEDVSKINKNKEFPIFKIFRLGEIEELCSTLKIDKTNMIRSILHFSYWPLEKYSKDLILISFRDFAFYKDENRKIIKKISENLKKYKFLDSSSWYNLHDPETGYIKETLKNKREWLSWGKEYRFHPDRLKEVPEKTTPEKYLYGFGL